MSELLTDLVFSAARRTPTAPAIQYGQQCLSYAALEQGVLDFAAALTDLRVARGERVAVYLEKRLETVIGLFGASAVGAVFVPINPLLKPAQVAHILRDCNVRVLVTSASRFATLAEVLDHCHDLHTAIMVDDKSDFSPNHVDPVSWSSIMSSSGRSALHRVIDTDVAAILYTSGSTGLPKGVILSHRNMVAGARSVSQYLENTPTDRILSVLPLSFDAGLSQLTTAFHVGASVILMNYLLPREVIAIAARENVTGIAGVPPLWNQVAELDWPEAIRNSLRYFTNTGGHMPAATLEKLRRALPDTLPFLMYGLTEAFRSTYLPPSEIDRRPDSIGKAIPNAEILVVREDGQLCSPGEPGELVHRGALVSLGYWNDPKRTAERFRPVPNQDPGIPTTELAVWSGDTVRMDEEGFLYFIGRRDEMIKTSGYRVSPTEIEEVVYGTGLVTEAAAIGTPDEILGQAIVVMVCGPSAGAAGEEKIIAECRRQLPAYMVPQRVVVMPELPRNPNGKIDRKRLLEEYQGS